MRPSVAAGAGASRVRARSVRARALTVVCALLLWPAALAGQSRAPRSLSFDTRYAIGTYSNDALADFGVEALDLAAFPAESITLRGAGGALARGLVLLVGTELVGQAYRLSYHEFGHGTRAAATGFRPHFGFGTPTTDAEIDAALASGALHRTFFGYFFDSFFQRSGYTLLTNDDVLFPPPSDPELADSGWDLLFAAGGLNNDMLFTERLHDRIQRGGGHAGMLSNWVNAKISTARYGDGKRIGDVGAALNWYQAAGFDIERESLLHASTMSLLFSATSYELVYRIVRVFGGDPIRYEPWTPYGIELPNTAFFMTTAGLSFRVSSGYRCGRWRFPVAVEHVFNGRERTELTLGGEWSVAPFLLGARVTVGERLGAAVSVDRRIGDRFLVSGGYALYDSGNLLGERMIPSLESGRRYHDFFVRLGVVY